MCNLGRYPTSLATATRPHTHLRRLTTGSLKSLSTLKLRSPVKEENTNNSDAQKMWETVNMDMMKKMKAVQELNIALNLIPFEQEDSADEDSYDSDSSSYEDSDDEYE